MKLEIWFGVLPGNQLMQKYHMSESSEIWIDVDLEHLGANIRANNIRANNIRANNIRVRALKW